MNSDVQQAYDWLTPADQLVVDSVIITIYAARKESNDLARAISDRLSDDAAREERALVT